MKRALLIVTLVAMAFAAMPPQAYAADDGHREKCETYCAFAVAACYVAIGWLVGRDKCDRQYEGCMDGCMAVLEEEEK
jgi:hypothetical protein